MWREIYPRNIYLFVAKQERGLTVCAASFLSSLVRARIMLHA